VQRECEKHGSSKGGGSSERRSVIEESSVERQVRTCKNREMRAIARFRRSSQQKSFVVKVQPDNSALPHIQNLSLFNISIQSQ
jgi:hypothetical protein